MATLTTHVLDQSSGKPGQGIRVELYRIGSERELLSAVETNADGRTDSSLLSDEMFTPGEYELLFYVGDYFRATGLEPEEPAFLDTVVIRVGLSGDLDHYHVPLLVAPYAYSTYRGS